MMNLPTMNFDGLLFNNLSATVTTETMQTIDISAVCPLDDHQTFGIIKLNNLADLSSN